MAKVTVDPYALHAALDAKRRRAALSWRQLASQLDVSPSTFSRMARGRRPDVDTFGTLLHWLEVSAERFMRPTLESEGNDYPISMISTHLRAGRNLRPEDADALHDVSQAAYELLIQQK
jgi:transcriptional regulator with XRE-family HTH domain